MFLTFLVTNHIKKNIGYIPLRVHQHNPCKGKKRTPQSVSQKGSMTVEAAVVLPVLICALTVFLFLGKTCYLYYKVETALLETARQTARQEYFAASSGHEGVAASLAKVLFLQNMEQGNITDGIEAGYYDLSGTEYLDDTGEICFVVGYKVDIPLFLLGNWEIPLEHRVIQKAWNGYRPLPGETEGTEGQYVYITMDGSVYHIEEDCYHLHVTVRKIQNVTDYYEGNTDKEPCEICVEAGTERDLLFVSEEGDCYHETLSCPGLTRRMKRVMLKEVEEKRPCADCSS